MRVPRVPPIEWNILVFLFWCDSSLSSTRIFVAIICWELQDLKKGHGCIGLLWMILDVLSQDLFYLEYMVHEKKIDHRVIKL